MAAVEKLKQFHENYLSAKDMVQAAEESATKTIKFLPFFRRVFPGSLLEQFKSVRQLQETRLQREFCEKKCEQNRECEDVCADYYRTALADGHEYIRKVQKEYKLSSFEEQE